MLVNAMVMITLALVFYTLGVWAEKIQGTLKGWHLIVFWLGLLCDSLGTKLMGDISGGFSLSFHAVTGFLAIVLMLFHAIWATKVLKDKDQVKMEQFHKFSIFVWIVWLIPYLSGALFGMTS